MTESMTTFYAIVYDNGDDSVELENFPTHAEASAYLKKEIEEWTNGTSWDEEKKHHKENFLDGEDYQIQIEVIQKDEEDCDVYQPLECWDSETGVLETTET